MCGSKSKVPDFRMNYSKQLLVSFGRRKKHKIITVVNYLNKKKIVDNKISNTKIFSYEKAMRPLLNPDLLTIVYGRRTKRWR